MSKWQWILRQFGRRLWVRASLIGALGVAAAILAAIAERFLPWQLTYDIGADAVDSILSIIASSMLAVTTFSLSVMTSAFGAATSNVTPRATRLLVQDRITQNVLSTFIGAFLFGIVGIIVLKTGAYGPQGRVVLFVVTIGVVILVVGTLMGWIDHLTTLGRVGETTRRVEDAAHDAIETRLRFPCLGGRPADPDAPELPLAVPSRLTGYVQHVDVAAVAARAEALEVDVRLCVVPGSFVYEGTPLACFDKPSKEAGEEEIADALEGAQGAFSIGQQRSYDQDPRFGLEVLSEIAQRALSPAVNDPGTAIDVIGRCTRLLTLWANGPQDGEEIEVRYERVMVTPLTPADLFDDAFRLIARDGAALVEVQLRLQKALHALSGMGDEAFREAARHQSRLALERAEAALALEDDKRLLREAALRLAGEKKPSRRKTTTRRK
ncbi:DUF2254 domain-containing protein [Ancylobacter sp. MQZ15Z-1]|uniref:DUF2254 domain-containing protein n=1 Tax=Ancylobacter mangrovi TaxID=2972472 RepID=A0A9X2T538_9HYPH|nr:DUF2254 domain-containing protein [Ancylobacter mangrovi]MCS0496851.1 DUF2254 domain-containing protein [Ancylobacter mangrovi]